MFNNFIAFSQQQASLSGLRSEKPTFYRDFTLDPQLNGPISVGALPSLTRIGPDISFTRSTSATYIDRNGNIALANINEPRFEWSDHRTNLLSASNDINSSAWVGYGTKSPDWRQDTVGPDGVANSAWSIPLSSSIYISPTFARNGIIQVIPPLLSGTPITVSAWVKADDTSAFAVSLGTSDGFNPDIKNQLTTNWKRFTYSTYYNPGAPNGPRGTQFVVVSGTGSNPNSKVYVYGFQCEIGTTATSYISTGSQPVTVSTPKGLLIEEQRTNLIPQNDLTHPSQWSRSTSLSSTRGSGIAGLSSFVITTQSEVIGYTSITTSFTLMTTGTYNCSFYATNVPQSTAAAVARIAWVTNTDPVSTYHTGIYYRPDTLQYLGPYATISNSVQNVSAADFKTYKRFSFNTTFSSFPLSYAYFQIYPAHGIGGPALTGTCEVAGIQVEQGTTPTSYIPTAGTQVTKAADNATISGSSFTNLYNKKEGTLFVEGVVKSPVSTPWLAVINDNSTVNHFGIYTRIGTTSYVGTQFQVNSVPSPILRSTQVNLLNENIVRAGTSYNTTSATLFVNNANIGTTSIDIPKVLTLHLGKIDNFGYINGYIRKVGYWPKRLSNTSLRALTLSSLGFAKYFAEDASLYTGTGPGVEVYRNSQATYFDSNGVLRIAGANKPRFNYDPVTKVCQGLLVEEARTNSIRNSQAGGAVAGTPGTPPTNWNFTSTTNGVTRQIVGAGTDNGLSYIDVRYHGTPTATGFVTLPFETATQVVAADAQTWTNSAYVKLEAGAFTNATYGIGVQGGTAGGSSVAGQSTANTTLPTGDPLISQRRSATRTMSSASVERVFPYLFIGYTSGNPINLTLRIAAPQLEQGSFPTSYIPTTNAAVTRAEDIIQVNSNSFDSFYNPEQGTFYTRAVPLSGAQTAAVLDIGDTYNSIHGIWKSGPGGDGSVGTQWNAFTDSYFLSAGAQYTPLTANFTSNLNAANSASYIAYSYGPSTFAASVSSSLMTQSTAVSALPSLEGFSYFNGHIQSIEYYNTQLTNQQLTALSN
jgi:hypothetical protein